VLQRRFEGIVIMLRQEFLVAGWLITLIVGTALADKPPAVADLAVDQVILKGGPRLLGSVLGRESDGSLAVAVGRAWLKGAHAEFFEKALKEEITETRQALTELRVRGGRPVCGDRRFGGKARASGAADSAAPADRPGCLA
jgi:hypothetical protein